MLWPQQIHRRAWFWLAICGLAIVLAWAFYPNDKTPKGSYYRVMAAVNRGQAAAVFPYLETHAQHAAFTIGNYTRQSRDVVLAAYPEPEKSRELERLSPVADVEPGPGVFAWYAERYGWMDRLRRDLSGVKSIEIDGERATIETVKGTRYPFRRRDTGMWGLTLFTARLVDDGQKAARDHSQVEAAASDYRAADR